MTSKQRKLRVPLLAKEMERTVKQYDNNSDIAHYAKEKWRAAWPAFEPFTRFYVLAITQRHGVDFEPPT